MLSIGLTGGIASGKTLVTGELRRRGARVLDADEIYHELLASDVALNEALRSTFGSDYFEGGHLDRKKLGRLVFSDPEARARLDRVTHPRIRDALGLGLEQARLAGTADHLIFVSAALLYEVGLEALVDRVVLVWVEPRIQLERLMRRNRLDETSARARLAAQWPALDKRQRVHHVIDNSDTIEETLRQVSSVHETLTREARRDA